MLLCSQEEALSTLRESHRGLDVNMYFDKVDHFEFTSVISLLDCLQVRRRTLSVANISQ